MVVGECSLLGAKVKIACNDEVWTVVAFTLEGDLYLYVSDKSGEIRRRNYRDVRLLTNEELNKV